jgi:hypothetical protein
VADHEASGHGREVLGDGAVDALVLEREAGTAVLLGVGQSGEAGVGEFALERARGVDIACGPGAGVLAEELAASFGEGVGLLGREFSVYGDGMYAAIQS